MRLRICDKCKKPIEHVNRVHVYNYQVRVYAEKRIVNRPKRTDFDTCENCRLELLKWFGVKINVSKKR